MGESFKVLTPRQLREWLSNVPMYSKEKIINDAKSVGLSIKRGCEKGELGHLDLIDKRGRIRLKIHPPDKKTIDYHLHLYDKCGNSLNRNLKNVKYNSPEAHIKYRG